MTGEDLSAEGFPGLSILLVAEDGGWAQTMGGSHAALAAQALGAAAAGAGLAPDVETEIGVTLADDAAVRALNAEWRGKDRPTNILSFPMVQLRPGDAPGPMLGDLILARETLVAEAADAAKSVDDHFRHLLVHGMLHLLGHDHEDDAEAEAMERLEILILSTLAIADPYADSETIAGVEPAS